MKIAKQETMGTERETQGRWTAAGVQGTSDDLVPRSAGMEAVTGSIEWSPQCVMSSRRPHRKP